MMKFFFSVIQKGAQGTVTEKVKNRLEQLDDFEEVGADIMVKCMTILYSLDSKPPPESKPPLEVSRGVMFF